MSRSSTPRKAKTRSRGERESALDFGDLGAFEGEAGHQACLIEHEGVSSVPPAPATVRRGPGLTQLSPAVFGLGVGVGVAGPAVAVQSIWSKPIVSGLLPGASGYENSKSSSAGAPPP